MKAEQYDLKNSKLEVKLDLNDSIWSVKLNPDLISQVSYVYQSNARVGLSHAKTKGDVSGGGRKPFKQKGTGRARAGSIRSPIWRGGGVTFAPNNVNWSKRINSKMKASALKMMLSERLADKHIKFVLVADDAKLADYRAAFIDEKGKLLVVTDNKEMYFALRNLTNVTVVSPSTINAYDVLKFASLVIDSTAVAKLEERFTDGK
jgi:large subunit ribosomal protein L4